MLRVGASGGAGHRFAKGPKPGMPAFAFAGAVGRQPAGALHGVFAGGGAGGVVWARADGGALYGGGGPGGPAGPNNEASGGRGAGGAPALYGAGGRGGSGPGGVRGSLGGMGRGVSSPIDIQFRTSAACLSGPPHRPTDLKLDLKLLLLDLALLLMLTRTEEADRIPKVTDKERLHLDNNDG